MDREPRRKANGATFLTAALFLAATTQLHAGSIASRPAYLPQAVADESGEFIPRPSAGRFFQYDQTTGKVWIDDFVYRLRAGYRVIGSSTKLGLLSAIRYREAVEFKTAPNPEQPSIPYIVEIRRK